MEILIKASQLLLSLSLLVLLHELGHFIPAKLFKTRVEKFYLFFDPWFSLFKFKKGDTEYGIGWIPLGGYVKISGMIDESMDKEQMSKPPEPWEFRSKPTWQRLIIMIGGVVVNLILGAIIYIGTSWYYGETVLPNKNIKDGYWVISPIAEQIGLENGDKIISINNEEVANYSDILEEMIYGGDIEILRNGNTKHLTIPENFISELIESDSRLLIYPRIPFIISNIPDSSYNANAGLLVNDRVIGLDSIKLKYYDQFGTIASKFKNKNTTVTVIREKDTLALPVTISANGKIGVVSAIPTIGELNKLGLYKTDTKKYTFLEAVPVGINKGINKLESYIRQFKLIFNPDTGAYKGVGGFGSLGNLFPPVWDWQSFWNITAFLSLILAFMNILPIPALDGGHVMFLLYEMITGRKPNEKFLEIAQTIGMILLFGLLIFANGNDVLKLFK